MLQLAFDCRNWDTLPLSGGLYAQPLAEMVRMNHALMIYNVVNSYNERPGTAGDWAEKYPALDNVYRDILRLRDEAAG